MLANVSGCAWEAFQDGWAGEWLGMWGGVSKDGECKFSLGALMSWVSFRGVRKSPSAPHIG